MVGNELAERSADQARATDAAILAALDLPGDAPRPVAELATLMGRPESTIRGRVARLARHGLVVRHGGERGPVGLTREGRAWLASPATGAGLGSDLGAALALLPCEAFRAMVRLMLAAVVARHHLRGRLPRATWSSFVAIGDTGAGKTLLARLVCGLFGLEELGHLVQVPRSIRGDLLGRREAVAGGGWRLAVPKVLGEPFLVLDEWEKADAEARAAALVLMQGAAAELVDGQRVEVAPVVYATSNATYGELRRAMGDAYLGRSVVLDARGLPADRLAEVRHAARTLLAPGVLPRLRLAELVPPVDELPAEWVTFLDSCLLGDPPGAPGLRLLSERGRNLMRVEALALLPLGLAALYPASVATDRRLAIAVCQVLLDYLTVASTVDGFVAPGWAEACAPVAAHLRQLVDDQGAAVAVGLPDLAAGVAERAACGEQARRRRLARDVEADELVARRALLSSRYQRARASLDGRKTTSWPDRHKETADSLRAVFVRLAADTAAAKTEQALDDIERRASEVLEAAAALQAHAVREVEAAKAERERDRAQKRQAAADARALASGAAQYRRELAAAVKTQEKAARQMLGQLRVLASRKTTKRGEDVPAQLVRLGLAERVGATVVKVVPEWQYRVAMVLGSGPDTNDRRVAVYRCADERTYTSLQLATWHAPATRSVLAAGRAAWERLAGPVAAALVALPAGALTVL